MKPRANVDGVVVELRDPFLKELGGRKEVRNYFESIIVNRKVALHASRACSTWRRCGLLQLRLSCVDPQSCSVPRFGGPNSLLGAG